MTQNNKKLSQELLQCKKYTNYFILQFRVQNQLEKTGNSLKRSDDELYSTIKLESKLVQLKL